MKKNKVNKKLQRECMKYHRKAVIAYYIYKKQKKKKERGNQ